MPLGAFLVQIVMTSEKAPWMWLHLVYGIHVACHIGYKNKLLKIVYTKCPSNLNRIRLNYFEMIVSLVRYFYD